VKNKETAAVRAARAEVEAAQASLTRSEVDLEAARKRCSEAIVNLRKVYEQADESMPQCRCVSISRYGYRPESDVGMRVILRKTPTGLLVTRPVGEPDRAQISFVWSKFNGVYREKTSSTRGGFYASSHLELRDVPEQFMPEESA
jgi:hypothetical protein